MAVFITFIRFNLDSVFFSLKARLYSLIIYFLYIQLKAKMPFRGRYGMSVAVAIIDQELSCFGLLLFVAIQMLL